ncbi:MAG: hypothetical protein ACR2HS_01780, partial [Gammaproteobacteria bacterium]
AIDTAPINVVPSNQNINQNNNLIFSSINGNTININDLDLGEGSATLTLSVNNGALSLNSLSGLTNVINNASTITATGNLTNLNAALNGLVYKPNINYAGTDNLTMTVGDNGNSGIILTGANQLITTSNVAITVNPFVIAAKFNNMPALSSNTYIEGGNGVVINNSQYFNLTDPQLSLLNSGLGDYSGAKLTIATSSTTPNADLFTFGSMSGISASNNNLIVNGYVIANFTNNNGVLQINFVNNGLIPSSLLFNQIVQSITYANTSNNPPNSVNINYIFDNGLKSANSIVSSGINLNISSVDNPPVNNIPVDQNINQNAILTFSSANHNAIVITDVDTSNATVNLNVTNGILNLSTTSRITVAGDGSGSVTLSGNINNINAALDGLTFTPNINYHGAINLSISTNDNASISQGGPLITNNIITINVNSLNNSPTFSNMGTVSNNFNTEGSISFINNST